MKSGEEMDGVLYYELCLSDSASQGSEHACSTLLYVSFLTTVAHGVI